MKKNKIPNKVYVALPAMDEADYLPEFIECLRNQSFRNFIVFVCVNQPDEWWEDEDRISICQNNKQSIKFLKSIKDMDIQIIDGGVYWPAGEEDPDGHHLAKTASDHRLVWLDLFF